jgi:hypothetical protein
MFVSARSLRRIMVQTPVQHDFSPSFQSPIDPTKTEPRGPKIVQLQKVKRRPSDGTGEYDKCQRSRAQNCRGTRCQLRKCSNNHILHRIEIYKARANSNRGKTTLENIHDARSNFFYWVSLYSYLPSLVNLKTDSQINCPINRAMK